MTDPNKHPLRSLVFTALMFIAAIIAGYGAGRSDGIQHAIEDSEIYATERYDPEHPQASAWNGYDLKIYIDLDGHTYEHGAYQG